MFYITSGGDQIYLPKNYIYCEPHQYSYTRDIIVNIKPTDTSNCNELVLMSGISYEAYLNTILNNIFGEGSDECKIYKEKSNVKLQLLEIIKTAPLEYRANYLVPDIDINNSVTHVKSMISEIPSTSS
jgi:hypothetical protein